MKCLFRALCESYCLVSNRQRFEDLCLILGFTQQSSNCSQPKEKNMKLSNYRDNSETRPHSARSHYSQSTRSSPTLRVYTSHHLTLSCSSSDFRMILFQNSNKL